MKKGFTLVELLAVIAILALIALIVVPIVTNIIYDSKKRTEKQSVELYGRAIENAVSAYFVKYPNDNAVTLSQLESEDLIKNKGNKVECDIVQIVDREVYLDECTVGDVKVNYTYGKILIPGVLISDANADGKISKGDKYSYKVNDKDTFNFYVLTDPTQNGEVNLIMDRNICEDGTVNYTGENNYCVYLWDENETNNLGPETAMQKLYIGTKGWKNVPNINLTYDDITDQIGKGYAGDVTFGYGGISIVNGVGKIISKSGEEQDIKLIDNKPIKARLPKYSEVYGNDVNHCNEVDSSCPSWLIENSTYLNNIITEEGIQYKLGDVNNDGKITEEDADLIQKYLAWHITLSNSAIKAANVYKDDDLNANDATAIGKYSYGILMDPFTQNIVDNQHNYGYWLISSMPNDEDEAFAVGFDRNILFSKVTNNYFGVRPVITVPTSKLTNTKK